MLQTRQQGSVRVFQAAARRRRACTYLIGLGLSACASAVGGPNVTMTPVLERISDLPDSQEGRVPAGFTITGLTRITGGRFRGHWLAAAGSGRLVEGDDSLYAAAVHVLSDDFTAIVRTFDFAAEGEVSVQGLAYREKDDSFFAAFNGAQQIRHYDMKGGEIAADRISFPVGPYDWEPNGLALHPDLNQLFVANRVGDTVIRLHADRSVGGDRLVAGSAISMAVPGVSTSDSPDHLHYDPSSDTLFYSVGANGSPGEVRARTGWTVASPSGNDRLAFGPLLQAQAIEGIYVDQDHRHLFVANDGGFHNRAKPPRNVVLTYALGSPDR